MAKRKTIKPVKAWADYDGRGKLASDFNCNASVYLCSKWQAKVVFGREPVRVTVSVDDPAASTTRISAAQRRVVEAAVAMVGAAVVWRTNVVSIKSPYGRLINAVDALERAKGDRK
jgi:hypothetical protein